MGLPIEEQETNVNFSRYNDRAIIYTSDSTIMTKLNKLIEADNTEWKLEEIHKLRTGEIIGRTYSCPKTLISFRTKRSTRTYTAEEKAKIAERFKLPKLM